MKVLKYALLVIFAISFTKIYAQNTIVNGEVGVYLGPTFFQGDYGEAGNSKSSTSNVGVGFGIAYVMNFSDSRYRSNFFSTLADHIKERVEFSYAKIKLDHNPVPVVDANPEYDNFKAMKGETKITNLGLMSEIYISSISRSPSNFKPYLLTGISMSWASPDINSSMPIPSAYITGNQKIFLKKQSSLSFSYGVGTRYSLDNVDLVLEMNMRSFSSDRIDGLDPEVSGDKSNDSTVSFRFGAVFHLDNGRR